MARWISILALTMQCIIGMAPAHAGIGHTTNNGGGLGEIGFADVWKNLDQTLAPCLAENGPCTLSPALRARLQAALEARSAAPPALASRRLYTAAGEPLPRAELTRLALAELLACDGGLTKIDFEAVVTRALSYVYFREFDRGVTVSLNVAGELHLLAPAGDQDLSALLRGKLRLPANSDLHLKDVSARASASTLDISGTVQVNPGSRVHFQFHGALEALELLVFP